MKIIRVCSFKLVCSMWLDTFLPRLLGVFFGKWLGWAMIIWLLPLSSVVIENVVGGDCVISGSHLYYLGGQIIKSAKSLQSRRVENNLTSLFRRQNLPEDKFDYIVSRRLNLETGFEIQKGYAPWANINNKEVSLKKNTYLMYSQIVSRGSNHTGILVFGGAGSKMYQELLDFDADALQFYVNIKGSSFIRAYSQSKRTSAPLYGTLVQNEESPTEFLLFGGIQLFNESKKTNLIFNVAAINRNSTSSDNRVFKYSSKDRTWSVETEDGQPSFMHSAIFYKGKMYVFGGINPQTLKYYPWNQIRIYNIKTKIWEISEIKGPNYQPRFGHRAIRVKETMVIAGGIIGNPNIQNPFNNRFDDRILVLNLVTLKWASVASNGWRGSYLGCLSFYNDQLIYAFGLTKNQPTQGKTYIINVKTWKLEDSFSPVEPQTNYQLWFFLACGFLGLLPCLFIIGIILYRRWLQSNSSPPATSSSTFHSQEKSRTTRLKVPSPLNYFLWTNSVFHPNPEGENVMSLTESSSEHSIKASVSRRVIEAHMSSLDNGHMNIPDTNFIKYSSNNIPVDVFSSNESNNKKISFVLRKPSTSTTQSIPDPSSFSNTLCLDPHIDSKNPRNIYLSPNSRVSPVNALQQKSTLKIKPTIKLDKLELNSLSPHPKTISDAQSQFTILSAPFTPGFSFLMANSPRNNLISQNNFSLNQAHLVSKNQLPSIRRVSSLYALASRPPIVLPIRRGSVGWCRELDQQMKLNDEITTWERNTCNPRPSYSTLLHSSSFRVSYIKGNRAQIQSKYLPS